MDDAKLNNLTKFMNKNNNKANNMNHNHIHRSVKKSKHQAKKSSNTINHKNSNNKSKSNDKKSNSPLKVTKTEVKNKHTKSNNKTGHVLLTPIMIDIHQVAQIDALKRMLKLKNRAQALEILMNKRQTVSDVIAKLSKKIPNAKEQFEMRYKIFLDDHEPKVKQNYQKYHTPNKQ